VATNAARLLNALDLQSGEWIPLIRQAQADLRAPDRVIKVLRPTGDVVITVEIADHPGAVTLSLGFPFALASTTARTIRQDAHSATAVNIHRTGPQIDRFQRRLLANAVRTRGRSLDWRETSSRAEFRARADEVLDVMHQLAVFADRFMYIGDAIQHLAEWDIFSSVVSARSMVATTRVSSLRGMLGFDYGEALDALVRVERGDAGGVLLVMPCWVDSHWPGIVDVALAALGSHPQSAVLVPGNNLVITNENRAVAVTHLAIDDYRLSDLPVEQSLAPAMSEFRECDWPVPTRQRGDPTDAVVIAPFTSHIAKNLTALQLAPLLARLRDAGERVVLVSGNPHDLDAAAEFGLLSATLFGAEPVSLDLAQAVDLIARARFVVAADSSLAHAARRLETPGVTIYNEPYWDGESSLALLHRSVVGFGTANPIHNHLVTGGNSNPLTPAQCEAVVSLVRHAVGETVLALQTEHACRRFAALALKGDAQKIVEAYDRLQREELGPADEWLAADLPLRRLLRPFSKEQHNRMARWLAALTMANKLVARSTTQ
jgi:hypothetical protein